jgi:uncharacterized protein YkwD
MQAMVRFLLTLLVIGGAEFARAIPPQAARPTTAPGVLPGEEQSSYEGPAERELLARANQSRAEASLSPLKMDACLVLAARRHAVLMAAREQLSHQFPDEAALSDRLTTDCTLRLDGMAENVAYGMNAAGVHDGFMHSPHHRENLLHAAYNVAGIGVVRRGSTLYVVEDFGHTLPALSAQGAIDVIAQSVQKIRAHSKLPRLERKDGSAAQSEACTLAQANSLRVPAPEQPGQVRYIVRYTSLDPQNLPSAAAKGSADPNLHAFAVGACFARNSTYSSGAYWVMLVFY